MNNILNNKVTTLVFLRRDQEVLLAMKKRGLGVNLWNGAGGKLNDGETVEQAMIRETQEEIGVTPTKYHKVAEQDFRLDAETDAPWHMYTHVYIADEWTGEPIESEEMAPQWFKITEIPYEQMWPSDTLWLPQALSGQKITGAYQYASDNTIITHDIKIVEDLPGEIPSQN